MQNTEYLELLKKYILRDQPFNPLKAKGGAKSMYSLGGRSKPPPHSIEKCLTV